MSQPEKSISSAPAPVTKLNPFLKNFFFSALKSHKRIKEGEKKIGKFKSLSIVITQGRTFMRATGEKETADIDFTPEERTQLLKTFKVKQSTIDESKSIFLMLDMVGKNIHIQQSKMNGEKINLTL